MARKGELIREHTGDRTHEGAVDEAAWIDRMAIELKLLTAMNGDEARAHALARVIAAMFDAGAHDREVAAYLEHSRALDERGDIDFASLAAKLHRLAAG